MSRVSEIGVRIAGLGSAVPSTVLSNQDLEVMMDTSDEWIVQRTGIRERRIIDQELVASDLNEDGRHAAEVGKQRRQDRVGRVLSVEPRVGHPGEQGWAQDSVEGRVVVD